MIKLKSITKTIKGDRDILSNISLEIEQGEYVAIIGKSGAGKSTLLNIIAGVDKPTSGEYTFQDKIITCEKDRLHLRRKDVSFVMQNFALVETMSVLDNILLKKKDKKKANELLEKLGILNLKNKKIQVLSGGEKQRVAIARAMVSDSKVIVADEPTGALDSATGLQIMEILKEINDNGVSIVLVTHDQSIINNATKIVELNDGKIVECKNL